MTTEEETRYTEIIDGILATADLETVTRKKIRMGLEAALGGKDLSDQKVRNSFSGFRRCWRAELASPRLPRALLTCV